MHATLTARHGTGSQAAVAVAASLATAKASLNDVHGALKHAQEVVDVVVRSLQELEHTEAAKLDEEGVAVLEQTLARMTNLYAQHKRLDLAANTAERALQVGLKIYGPAHLKVAELRRLRAELLLESGEEALQSEALELLLAARQVLMVHQV